MVSLAVALTVVGVATWVLRDRIQEEWWLYQLEHGDEADAKAAAERLAKMGSVKGVQTMLRALRATSADNGYSMSIPMEAACSEEVSSGDIIDYHPSDVLPVMPYRTGSLFLINAIGNNATMEGKASTKPLMDALSDEDWYVRYVAVDMLGRIGCEAKAAVPILVENLRGSLTERGVAYGNVSELELRMGLGTARGEALQIVRTLGYIGPGAGSAIKTITGLLQDRDEELRAAAARVLKTIESTHADPR